MATEIGDAFPDRRGRGPRAEQIAAWANGNVWRIERGADYDCDLASLRGTLGSWAWRNGYHLRSTTRFQPDGVLLIKFERKEE